MTIWQQITSPAPKEHAFDNENREQGQQSTTNDVMTKKQHNFGGDIIGFYFSRLFANFPK